MWHGGVEWECGWEVWIEGLDRTALLRDLHSKSPGGGVLVQALARPVEVVSGRCLGRRLLRLHALQAGGDARPKCGLRGFPLCAQLHLCELRTQCEERDARNGWGWEAEDATRAGEHGAGVGGWPCLHLRVTTAHVAWPAQMEDREGMR